MGPCRSDFGIFHAGRIRTLRGGTYPGEKYGKYPYEKHDGFLYRNTVLLAGGIQDHVCGERTSFKAFCIYSAVISLVVYPISGHWIWAAYVLIVMFIVFKIIDKTVGLRVPAQVEIDGLDIREHGLVSAYSGFAINDMTGMDMDVNENTDLGEDDYSKASESQINAALQDVE